MKKKINNNINLKRLFYSLSLYKMLYLILNTYVLNQKNKINSINFYTIYNNSVIDKIKSLIFILFKNEDFDIKRNSIKYNLIYLK